MAVTKSRHILRPRRYWTAPEIAILRKKFPHMRTADLADQLGRRYANVADKANKLGLRKSRAFLGGPEAGRLTGVSGKDTRFRPGHDPWNKGTHFIAGGRSAETRYRKGNISGRAAQLVLPIGSYRINADGYLDRKFSDTPGPQTLRWRSVHRLVWEAAHGPVPADHVVCFKPGRRSTDPEQITIDALELVHRLDLLRRNTLHRYGPEIVAAIQLRGALVRRINAMEKEKA